MVAGGCTPFRKYFPEYKLEELVMMGYKMMLEDNDLKLSPKEVKDSIQYAAYGEFADHFQDQLLCEAKIHDYLGLDPLWNTGIKTGGATGGAAMLNGCMAVASGYADCALVSGWERMDEVDTRTGNFYIAHRRLQGLRDPHGPHLQLLLRAHGQSLCRGLQPLRGHPCQGCG